MTSVVLAALVTGIGLLDQLPPRPGLAKQQQIARAIESDRELGRRLEESLPAGAMVFQLPVMVFPEIVSPNQLTDYEYFRPYLATQSLHFTYGALKGRSRNAWQREVERMGTAEQVRRLERFGFAALHFSRKGFADRGEQLLAEMAAAGRSRRIESPAGDQVVVLLEPAARPEPAIAQTLTFGRGWHSAEDGWPRWAYGPAALSYFNPYPHPVDATVRLVLSGVDERKLGLQVNRGEPESLPIGTEPVTVTLEARFRPGVNRIDLQADRGPVRVSNGPRQLRSHAVHETAVTLRRVP